ncbi:MAG: PLP-dependent aminotransferase family protein [bacterium]|nr:PLP-dependent aminotransferase family protein [bacterium]
MSTEPLVGGLTPPLQIDPRGTEPLQRQLGRALRAAIHSGALAPGARLPSTRALAADLGLSRNTVLYAYEQLEAEGYLVPRRGAGTYVAATLAWREESGARADPVRPPRLAARVTRTAALAFQSELPANKGPFLIGLPDLESFPRRTWARLAARRLRSGDRTLVDHGDPRGRPELREAIAAYVRTSRGVRCTSDQVVVVNGSQHALALAGAVLIDPGDTVWVEEPGYRGARAAFLAAGARLAGIPLEPDGIDLAAGAARREAPRLIFVTPSNQFPTGVTLSMTKRLALLACAREHDAFLIEDDYDSEFRYVGAPVPALQGLDADGRVLYVGTFSKTLSPAVRVGYLVLPPQLVEPFAAMRAVGDPYTSSWTQAVLADFLLEGHYTRHVARMRRLYRTRRRFLEDALASDFADVLRVWPAGGGLHLVAGLARGMEATALSRALGEADVKATSIAAFHLDEPSRPALVLGYAGFGRERTAAALVRMRAVFDAG